MIDSARVNNGIKWVTTNNSEQNDMRDVVMTLPVKKTMSAKILKLHTDGVSRQLRA